LAQPGACVFSQGVVTEVYSGYLSYPEVLRTCLVQTRWSLLMLNSAQRG